MVKKLIKLHFGNQNGEIFEIDFLLEVIDMERYFLFKAL